ncbi:MAG: hypothetical protein AAF604_14660 [Acidobacteriota bacterium]
MIECQEKTDVRPCCPHCKTDLTTLWFQEMRSVLGRRYAYFCPECRGIVGVSHRKGFWMG